MTYATILADNGKLLFVRSGTFSHIQPHIPKHAISKIKYFLLSSVTDTQISSCTINVFHFFREKCSNISQLSVIPVTLAKGNNVCKITFCIVQ